MEKFKKFYHEYLNNKHKLATWQQVCVVFLVVVMAGCLGWLYEFIFYYFNGGMTEWYLQGGNFLPWINIYATGSLLIILCTRKLKKKPLLVMLIAMLVTGVLEYISGWGIYHFMDGTRFWDYNTEIWNWGNIDGFVCLRSVLMFGLMALMLMYALLPGIEYLVQNVRKEIMLSIAIVLFSVVMVDEIYNLIVVRVWDVPSAVEIYKEHGYKYVE